MLCVGFMDRVAVGYSTVLSSFDTRLRPMLASAHAARH